MKISAFFRSLPTRMLLAVAGLLIPAYSSLAGDCCPSPEFAAAATPGAGRPLSLTVVPDAPWRYQTKAAGRRPRPASASRQFDYMAGEHLWLTGGLRQLPTGRPLDPEASNAERRAYSLARLGLGYMLSPVLRATTHVATGWGSGSAVPGRQFTVGVALRY